MCSAPLARRSLIHTAFWRLFACLRKFASFLEHKALPSSGLCQSLVLLWKLCQGLSGLLASQCTKSPALKPDMQSVKFLCILCCIHFRRKIQKQKMLLLSKEVSLGTLLYNSFIRERWRFCPASNIHNLHVCLLQWSWLSASSAWIQRLPGCSRWFCSKLTVFLVNTVTIRSLDRTSRLSYWRSSLINLTSRNQLSTANVQVTFTGWSKTVEFVHKRPVKWGYRFIIFGFIIFL